MTEFRTIERTSCPICRSSRSEPVLSHYDDRYGQPDLFDVVVCREPSCGLAFLKQRVSDEDLSSLYSKYYHHYSKPKSLSQAVDQFRNVLKSIRDCLFNSDSLCTRMKRGQRVLDVGCGYGPSKALLQNRHIEWIGLEVDPVKVSLNKSRGLRCEQLSLQEFARTTNETFDTILINQVLEHVSEPLQFFESIRKLLSKNSRAFISTPNYNSKYRLKFHRLWIHWHIPYHQLYFNIHSLERLAQETGLRVYEAYSRTPFPFYVLQHNIKPCERGTRNSSFGERFSFRHTAFFLDPGNFSSRRRIDEDCLYAQVGLA